MLTDSNREQKYMIVGDYLLWNYSPSNNTYSNEIKEALNFVEIDCDYLITVPTGNANPNTMYYKSPISQFTNACEYFISIMPSGQKFDNSVLIFLKENEYSLIQKLSGQNWETTFTHRTDSLLNLNANVKELDNSTNIFFVFRLTAVNQEQYFNSSTTNEIWYMRESQQKANYFEIRYKPLIPISSGSDNDKISFVFDFGLSNNSLVTFERFNNMDGIPNPVGTSYKNANRTQETLTLEWTGADIDSTREQRIILFDIASGRSEFLPIITSNVYKYSNIFANTNEYIIEAYIYQFRIRDITTQTNIKYYNTGAKLLLENVNSEMIIKNRRFEIYLYPDLYSYNEILQGRNDIFNYDDTIGEITNGNITENPLTDIDNIFTLNLNLEKIYMNSEVIDPITGEIFFNNADIIRGNSVIPEQLRGKNIYISGKTINSDGTVLSNSVYSDKLGENKEDIPIMDVFINQIVELNNNNAVIALGKGLIDNNTLVNESAFRNINTFKFDLKQNFLPDYWRKNNSLIELESTNYLNSVFSDLEYQRRVAASILLIDLHFSGQIFLINTASKKIIMKYLTFLQF